jgi:hypothetical protein
VPVNLPFWELLDLKATGLRWLIASGSPCYTVLILGLKRLFGCVTTFGAPVGVTGQCARHDTVRNGKEADCKAGYIRALFDRRYRVQRVLRFCPTAVWECDRLKN